MIDEVIENGSALDHFRRFIEAQEGDPRVCEDFSLLPKSKHEIPIIAKQSGWINEVNTQDIGYALIDVGAGRKILDSKLNYAAGAYLPYKVGDCIKNKSEIGKVYCDSLEIGKNVAIKILNSYSISQTEINPQNMILEVIRDNTEFIPPQKS